MKKFLVMLLAAVSCFACKKDSSNGKQLLLSKVYEDGLLKQEYFYDVNKKPQRRNNYSTGTGQSVLSGFRLYQYAGGLPKETSEYNKDNQFTGRYVVQYDINNRPTRLDFYNNDNTLLTFYVMDYNGDGKMAVYTATNVGTNKKTVEAQFTWDQHGHVTGVNRYKLDGNTKVKSDSTTFVFENKAFPTHWSYYELLPIIGLPNGDRTFYDMYGSSFLYYFVDAPPSITTTTYTNKTFNKDGLLTKQQITYSTTNGGAPTVNVVEKTYEYTE
jgi:hypothetical protein